SVTNTSPCWYGLIVPASTLMYGSIFCSVTLKPRASRSDPIEAAASPLPNDDTTPPVTKMYFVATSPSLRKQVSDRVDLRGAVRDAPVQAPVPELGEDPGDRRSARDAERHDLVARERDGRAVPAEVPVEHGARAAVAQEPEPPEHGGCLRAEQTRPRARRVRLGEPRDERPPLGHGPAEACERLAHERGSLERRGRDRRRLVAGEGQRRELDGLDAEAALPRPGDRPGERRDEAPRRGGETVPGVQEPEGAAPPEPDQRHIGARLGEDPLELGGDPLPRERRVRRQAERQRLGAGGRGVRDEPEARRVASGPEHAHRILDVRQRVEHAEPPPREIGAPTERIEQVEGARVELDGHRV